jgi:hypothetical protein
MQEVARGEAARLAPAQQEIWVQYADAYRGRPYGPAYFDLGFAPSYRTALLNAALTREYLISAMADLLADPDFERKLTQIVEERLPVGVSDATRGAWGSLGLLSLLQARAQELLIVVRRVQTQLAIEARQLENQRNARLEAIMEWERDLKEQVRGILEYLRQSESRQMRFGVVESVGCSPDGGCFCMIAGIDRLLGVGDKIGRVRVVKIDPEKVEFAKDGTTWVQSLGAPPQPFWD